MLMKRIVPLLLFLSVLLSLLTACGSSASHSPTPTPLPALVNYEKAIFTVERGSIVSKKDLMGEIVPSKQDELFFRASGYVNRVAVKAGDKIKKGDLMAEMQIDDLLNQLEQARIDLEVAQSNLAKYTAEHAYDLSKSKSDVVVAMKRVDLAQIDVDQAYGGVTRDRAKINLDIAQENLKLAEEAYQVLSGETNPAQEQTVKRSQLSVERLEKLVAERQIIAPYDGLVLRSMVRAGQQIDTFNSVFVVGDPTTLVVRSPYDYDLQGKLQESSEVSLKIAKDAQSQFSVKYLPNFLISTTTDQAPNSSSAKASDYLYFSLPQDLPQDQVKVGRQVFMTIILGKKDNVLLLPPAAIREYKGLYFVIVQDSNGRRRRVEINQIGLKSEDRWEIEGDLREGDQVQGP